MKTEFRKSAKKKKLTGAAIALSLVSAVILGSCREEPENDGSAVLSMTQEEADIIATPPDNTRSLTQGETQLIKKLFGNDIDLSNVQIYFYDETHDSLSSNVLMGDTDIIRIYGERYASDDYSTESNSFLYGTLVHQATRLWQNQNEVRWDHEINPGYYYNLHTSLKFDDYGPLRQAAIMEDYALRFLHQDHTSRWMKKSWGANNCSADEFLQWVVEDQFPQAKQTRLALEQTYMRPLTEAEIGFALALFGNAVDTNDLQQQLNPIKCVPKAAHVDQPDEITYWGEKYHEADYALTENLFNFGTYSHELTHIWQRQSGYSNTNWRFVNEPDKYAYPLDLSKWDFDNYSTEQQAAIVEDYVRSFWTEGGAPRRASATVDNLNAIKTLVETQFPQAKVTREFFEENGYLPFKAPEYTSNTTAPRQL